MTDGIKHDQSKPRLDYLPWQAIGEVGKITDYGARKYTPHNWRTITDTGRHEAAMLRHYIAWKGGEELDDESGLHHLAHMACNALFLLELRGSTLAK